MSRVLLQVRHLSKYLQDGATRLPILQDISLTIHAGERVALRGPSGSGKSTLLQLLGGLDAEYQGAIEVLGQELKHLSDAKVARLRNKTFGFVFQAYNLLPHLTALDNVVLPAYFTAGKDGANLERGRALLAQVGLQDKCHRRPRALSGGERQRVAIARALYNRPEVILCDEPTGNLDEQTARGVLEMLEALTADGVTTVMATHDPAIASRAHRTWQLQDGRLV